MGESVFRGPAYSIGSVIDGRVEVMDGPGLTYQGDGLPDPRFWPSRKDGLYAGRVPVFLNSPYFVLADNIPQATGTANIAALATLAGINTNFTLAAGALAQANGTTAGNPTMAPGVPLVPLVQATAAGTPIGSFNWTGVPTTALALDFGFTTGTTTAASANITVNDATLFSPGQWVAVGGAGNAGKTAPMVAYVSAINIATNVITMAGGSLNGIAAAAVTNAPIGNMAGPDGAVQPLGSIPNSVQPYLNGGLGNFFNPPEAVTRCLSVTGVAGGVGGAGNIFIARGFDVFGQPMTTTINGPVGATTVYFPKAMKYLTSVGSGGTFTDTTHTYSVGLSDTFGFNVRSDRYEYVQVFWNGTYFTTGANAWVAAVKTSPATTLTGDVRGTFQTGSAGTLTGGGGAASNGTTTRLLMAMTVPLYNDLFATPLNPVPLVGVVQA
jgi:hypothetical protein